MHKCSSFVLVCLSALAFCSAYDFDDPYYNDLLARDFELLDEPDVVFHRTRRDEEGIKEEKCKKKHWKGCCADQSFEEFHEKDKPLKKECFKQILGRDAKYFRRDPFKCDNIEKHRRDMACVAQCVLQKKNIVDASGKINEDTFRSTFKAALQKEAWLSPMLDMIATKCLKEAQNVSSPLSGAEKPGSGDDSDSAPCNPQGIKLGRCLYKEIQMSCPAEQIKDEKACARIRDRIKRNEDFDPHPQPQMDDDN